MTDAQLLQMVKQNLQITGIAWNDYLTMLIGAARQSIIREGITLAQTTEGDTLEDCNIVIMYASYLYRKRAGSETGMPRMLRYALNNRLMAEKAGGSNAV